jgi:hypothetical protein
LTHKERIGDTNYDRSAVDPVTGGKRRTPEEEKQYQNVLQWLNSTEPIGKNLPASETNLATHAVKSATFLQQLCNQYIKAADDILESEMSQRAKIVEGARALGVQFMEIAAYVPETKSILTSATAMCSTEANFKTDLCREVLRHSLRLQNTLLQVERKQDLIRQLPLGQGPFSWIQYQILRLFLWKSVKHHEPQKSSIGTLLKGVAIGAVILFLINYRAVQGVLERNGMK